MMSSAKAYDNTSKLCNLCLWEKYFIICRPELSTLNKHNELVSCCRHAKKFSLSNCSITWKPYYNIILICTVNILTILTTNYFIVNLMYILEYQNFKAFIWRLQKCMKLLVINVLTIDCWPASITQYYTLLWISIEHSYNQRCNIVFYVI